MEKLLKIGEVEKLTGIPRRQLKQFIEQKMMTPCQRADNGKYWLYNRADVATAQKIALYHELGYEPQEIEILLNDPNLDWAMEMDKQIPKLIERRDRLNRLILAAETLRYTARTDTGRTDFDISLFDGSVECAVNQALDTLRTTEDEVREVIGKGNALFKYYSEKGEEHPLAKLITMSDLPGAPAVQTQIGRMYKDIHKLFPVSPQDALLSLRMFFHLCGSGMELFLVPAGFPKGFAQFILDAIEIYCDNLKEGNQES